MRVNIDISIKGDNGGDESYRVVLNQDELTQIIKTAGVDAGNHALDRFVDTFVAQFKDRLAKVLNR